MSTVWARSKQKGTALVIILALADFANDDGVCWPSVSTLARKARTGKRNVQYLLQRIVQSGEISIQEGAGPNGVHLYTVDVGVQSLHTPTEGDAKAFAEGVQRPSQGGAKSRRKGVQRLSSKSSLTVKEPSEESSRLRATHLTYFNVPEKDAIAYVERFGEDAARDLAHQVTMGKATGKIRSAEAYAKACVADALK